MWVGLRWDQPKEKWLQIDTCNSSMHLSKQLPGQIYPSVLLLTKNFTGQFRVKSTGKNLIGKIFNHKKIQIVKSDKLVNLTDWLIPD